MHFSPSSSPTAARVIARFGGAVAVARALDIAPDTVARWPRDGGVVPDCHRSALLDHAERIGLPVVAADFLCDDPVHLCVGLADWWREAGGTIAGLDAWLTREMAARGITRG